MMTADSAKLLVKCKCGRKITASLDHAGKRMNCPQCGNLLSIPSIEHTASTSAPQSMVKEQSNRKTLFAMVGLAVVIVIGVSGFLIWQNNVAEETARLEEIEIADQAVEKAVEAAISWLETNHAHGGDIAEDNLTKALTDENVTKNDEAIATLVIIKKQRAEFQADRIFESAKTKVKNKKVSEAISLLKQYVGNSSATKLEEGKRLLYQSEVAISDKINFDLLLQLNDAEFEAAQQSGVVDDGKVPNQDLADIRISTIKRNLARATNRRAELHQKRLVLEENERNRLNQVKQEIDAAKKAERKRKLNPRVVSFKSLVNFPENYKPKELIKLEKVMFHGGLRRDKKQKVFSVTVSSTDGKIASIQLLGYSEQLAFVVDEKLGGWLDERFSSNMKTLVNLYCQIDKINNTPLAKIYRIETYNLAGNILDVYPYDAKHYKDLINRISQNGNNGKNKAKNNKLNKANAIQDVTAAMLSSNPTAYERKHIRISNTKIDTKYRKYADAVTDSLPIRTFFLLRGSFLIAIFGWLESFEHQMDH